MPSYTDAQLLCAYADVEDVVSVNGLVGALDDMRTGEPASVRKANLLERGSSRVRFYLSARYSDSVLQASVWVKWCAATICAYLAMMRKGMTPPPGFAMEYNEYMLQLKQIQDGAAPLPDGAPERITSMPTLSNVTVDGRYNVSKIRVETLTSVDYGQRDTVPKAAPYGPEWFQ